MIEIGADADTLDNATLAQLSKIRTVLHSELSRQIKQDEIANVLGTPAETTSASATSDDDGIDPALSQYEQDVLADLQEQGVTVAHPEQLTLAQLAQIEARLDSDGAVTQSSIDVIVNK